MHSCCLELPCDSAASKGSIPHFGNYQQLQIKTEFLVCCQTNEKRCASPHNFSLLLEKEMYNDLGFKSFKLLINNYYSFDIKKENGMSSIDNEKSTLKVKSFRFNA